MKKDKSCIRVKDARKAMKNRAEEFVKKNVANEIRSRNQAKLWQRFIKTLREKIKKLKNENATFRTYLKAQGIDTQEMMRMARVKKGNKQTKSKSKKVMIRAEGHEF